MTTELKPGDVERKAKSKTLWVVAGDGSNPRYPFGFTCTRCGQQDKLPERVPINVFVLWAKSFTRLHARCKP